MFGTIFYCHAHAELVQLSLFVCFPLDYLSKVDLMVYNLTSNGGHAEMAFIVSVIILCLFIHIVTH